MSERDEDKGLAGKKGEEFLQIFKKGAEFTQELMKENERLRYQVLQMEEAGRLGQDQGGAGDPEVERLRRKVEDLEQEKQEILDRIQPRRGGKPGLRQSLCGNRK